MAESVIPVKHLQDITECPICTDFYSDPRSLPCVHTFCLKCISSWVENNLSKDKVKCPMCRQEFAIPGKGIGDLPKNIFVGKLLAVKELSSRSAETVICDLCREENVIETTKVSAKVFCIECQQNLCIECSKWHSKIKAVRSHQIIGIGEIIDEKHTKCMPSSCDKHANEKLKVYCFDCQQTLCIVCFITQHSGHKAADIGEVVGDFRSKVDCGILKLAKAVRQLTFSLNKLQQSKCEIVDRFNRVECEINKKADLAIAIIKRQRQRLLHENNQQRENRVKEVENDIAEVVQNKTMAESLLNYCSELLKKGSSSDITRETKVVCTRVEEMEELCPAGVGPVKDSVVKFTSSDVISDDINCIGNVESCTLTTLLTRVLRPSLAHCNEGPVTAVARLNDELFVTRAAQAHDQIAVYDQSTLQLLRHITIVGATGSLHGLAGCPRNNCLYVSDFDNSSVYKVNLSMTSSVATKLFAAEKPTGLSVNGSCNVLVATWTNEKILEYNANGSFVREIAVDSFVWHAIELKGGAVVFSVCSKFHGVGLISSADQLLQKYGSDTRKSGRREMDYPRNLAVDSQGFVLVADQKNDRIVALNPTFSDVRQLAFDVKIKEPLGICLDESRGRLYVGENQKGKGGRLLVFDNVFNICSAFNK